MLVRVQETVLSSYAGAWHCTTDGSAAGAVCCEHVCNPESTHWCYTLHSVYSNLCRADHLGAALFQTSCTLTPARL
jgi:hypothetical protein